MATMIIEEKLESLRRCIQRLHDKRAASAEQLYGDIDRQDILALNLTRAVQICVDMATHILSATNEGVPTTMGQAFDALQSIGAIDAQLCQQMKAAVGFRNIAIHNYETINWDIVHAITWHHLDDFRLFARAISARVGPAQKPPNQNQFT